MEKLKMRDKMRRQGKVPPIPILSYYLTFIHYFGFSINQNDSSNSHNLSITKRRVTNSITKPGKVLNYSTDSPKSAINSRTAGKAIYDNYDDDYSDLNWFAHHKLYENQQQSNQKPRSSLNVDYFGSAFKKGIKFVAISFTAFLAFNHCIVLVDYIYQGSMRFEELMFDFRLVITKVSALIFVLTWHFNQAKVDRLIRLVKSTSIYILSTQNNNYYNHQIGDNNSVVKKKLVKTFSDNNLATTGLHLFKSDNSRSWARDQAGEKSFNEAFKELTKAQFEAIIKFNSNDKDEKKRVEDKEVYSFTDKVNKSVLKWWIMCICVTIVHFSLSEAEIFKSHHLWIWLDDYSMHQLSNKTTSLTTLMFLASFDNYIYTVHVYGARLIGASIICIVCSLQRKNIDSLRFQALQMLQVSSLFKMRENMRKNKRGEKVTGNNLVSRSEHIPSSSSSSSPLSNMKDIKHENIIVVSKRIKLDKLSSSEGKEGENTGFSMGGAGCMSSPAPSSLSSSSQNNNNFDVSFACQTNPECNLRIDNETPKSNYNINSNNDNNKIRQQTNYEFDGEGEGGDDDDDDDENDSIEISCPKSSRNLFFVLGESDWLKVQDNLKRLRPCGYLSSPLWHARKYLCFKVRQLIFGLVDIKKWKLFEKLSKKNKISCSRDLIMALNSSMRKRVELVRWREFEQQQQQQEQQKQEQELCRKLVTPTSTCLQGGAKGETQEKGKKNENENENANEKELPKQIDVTLNAKLVKSSVCSFALYNCSNGESSFETTPNDEEIQQNDHHHNSDHFHSNNDLFQRAAESSKTKVTPTTVTATTTTAFNHLLFGCSNSDDNKSENLFFIQNKRKEKNQQELNDDHLLDGKTHNNTTLKTNRRQQQSILTYVNTAEIIEWQLERLASKYELVRTVNSRIDSCFGPMLLIQYSFLFLMSCIDVVYFSICFNPNTKTKYIIISGMILLWWPYLLLYNFASDIGSSSKELLISVRRLARLSLVEHHQTSMLASSQQQQQQRQRQQRQRRPTFNKSKYPMNGIYGSAWVTCSPLTIMSRYHERPNLLSYHSPSININGTATKTTTTKATATNNFYSSTLNSLLYYDLKERLRFQSAGDKKSRNYYYTTKQQTAYNYNSSETYCLRNKGNYLNNLTSGNENNNNSSNISNSNNCHSHSPNNPHSTTPINKTRARIINKLDHVFKATNLSIIGIMTIDKFFLLNFAKIVITASVMVIQFISY